jgi:hypothetical protein
VWVPKKIRERDKHFARFPIPWVRRLHGAVGTTWEVAAYLLHLDFMGNGRQKKRGQPIKLANGMLKIDGVSRQSKWRALADLERRGLITVERRPRRSPIIRLCSVA